MTVTLELPSLAESLAWIGAIVGIAALAWQVTTRRRSTQQVKVTRTQSWFVYPDGRRSPAFVCVKASNVGSGPVTITGWGIALAPLKENIIVVDQPRGSATLPHRLEAGSDVSLYVEATSLRRARDEKGVPFQRMRGWVRLATGETV
jgi:hypothetical protein